MKDFEDKFYCLHQGITAERIGVKFWESYKHCCRKPKASHFANLCCNTLFYPNTKAHIFSLTWKEYVRYGKFCKFFALYKVISNIYQACNQAGRV